MCRHERIWRTVKGTADGKGITQKQLAAILNVSGNAVHCWECDKQEPSMSMLLALSEYFEVSLDFLFGKED